MLEEIDTVTEKFARRITRNPFDNRGFEVARAASYANVSHDGRDISSGAGNCLD